VPSFGKKVGPNIASIHSCLTSFRNMGDVVVLSATCIFLCENRRGSCGASWIDFPSGDVMSWVRDPKDVRGD